MIRKQGLAWLSAAVLAALGVVVLWPKSGRERSPRARPPVVVEEPPRPTNAPAPPPTEPSPVPALPEAPSPPPEMVAALEAEDNVVEPTGAERAQLARMPVIYAIRGDYPSDEARFEAMRNALRRSGPSVEGWTDEARSTFERWSSALRGIESSLDGASLRCYVAGCEMLVTFPDRERFEQGASKFRGIQEEVAMGRVQTPGISLPDGRVQVSWMLLRPDSAPPDAG